VQDRDPAAVPAAEEAEHERRHGLLIGTAARFLKLMRGFVSLH
jgi:hypothetical protein